MPRRTTWQLLIAATLLLMLAALATLQYRWLGQVSDAERDRLRASLRSRASAFADDFDSEITRIYMAFQAGPRFDQSDAAVFLSDALARAGSNAGIVKDVYLFEPAAQNHLARLDAARRVLEPAEWPASLDGLRQRTALGGPAQNKTPSLLLTNAIDATAPAFIIPLPRIETMQQGGQFAVLPEALATARVVFVVLDAGRMQQQLIEPLVARHFGDAASPEFYVTIVRRDDPLRIVYTSSPDARLDASTADVSAGIFDLRMNDLHAATAAADAGHTTPDPAGARTMARFAITIVRRAAGSGGARVLMTGDGAGEWQLLVRGRSGSLETLVAQSRRRNLAISLGILGLLTASLVLILGAAQRQQRLARQQMEFVAAVSHELRTPLAVICSAGENLADGVVADSQQVKRYGTLVETEGRRLAGMVERVMEFAGITSGTAHVAHVEVDLARVVAEAIAGASGDARERGVRIDVHTEDASLTVTGDADALRSAVQNLVGNAVKYSASGATVDVAIRANGAEVSVRVTDRGLGIDTRDLPHIFKPFFRGRRALDAQIRGSGVGLSVVRHVVDAHHGRIHVESRPGQGTTVTMELPAATGGDARPVVSAAS